MILRRVTEHVKTQNWFAVFVDFVIVVIGVFIGIQVANWNETRLEKKRADAALEVLLFEASENVAYADLIIHRNNRLQEHRRAAMTKLEGRTPTAGDPGKGLPLLAVIRDFTPRYTNYEELRAAGDMALLQSRGLRNQISNLVGVTRYNDRKRDEIIDTLPDILALAGNYVLLGGDGVEARPQAVHVDWAAARRDRALVNGAMRAMAAQDYWAERLELYRQEAAAMCDALGKAVGRDCQAPDWIADELAREEAADG